MGAFHVLGVTLPNSTTPPLPGSHNRFPTEHLFPLIDHGLAVKAKRDALGLPGAVIVIGWIGKVAFRIRGSSTIRHSGKATDANFSLCFSCTLLQRRFAAISYHTFLRSSK